MRDAVDEGDNEGDHNYAFLRWDMPQLRATMKAIEDNALTKKKALSYNTYSIPHTIRDYDWRQQTSETARLKNYSLYIKVSLNTLWPTQTVLTGSYHLDVIQRYLSSN